METTNFRKDRLRLIKEIIEELRKLPVFTNLNIYPVYRDMAGPSRVNEYDPQRTGYGLGITSGWWFSRTVKRRVVEIDCVDDGFTRDATLEIETFNESVAMESMLVVKSFQERIGKLFGRVQSRHYNKHLSCFDQTVNDLADGLRHLVAE